MYLLPRAIDGTIGINLIFSLVILLLIIAGTAEKDVLGRHKLVIVGRNQDISIHILEISLSVLIGCQAGMYRSFVLLRLEIIPLVIEFYLRPGDRLAISRPYRKPTQVDGERILRPAEEVLSRNSAK